MCGSVLKSTLETRHLCLRCCCCRTIGGSFLLDPRGFLVLSLRVLKGCLKSGLG
jgi:hypothetical protein